MMILAAARFALVDSILERVVDQSDQPQTMAKGCVSEETLNIAEHCRNVKLDLPFGMSVPRSAELDSFKPVGMFGDALFDVAFN